MSLKLKLKADEKLIVGGAVIRNGSKAIELHIENNVPILREKDIMKEEEACSPSRRLYFVVQLMYVDAENVVDYHNQYWVLAQEILTAAPSTKSFIEEISNRIVTSEYYQALKAARKLIKYEEELVANVRKSL